MVEIGQVERTSKLGHSGLSNPLLMLDHGEYELPGSKSDLWEDTVYNDDQIEDKIIEPIKRKTAVIESVKRTPNYAPNSKRGDLKGFNEVT